MNITDCTFSEKDATDPSKKGIISQQNSFLERELSRNGVLSVAKAGGEHLADRLRKNLERFGGGAQGTGRTRLVLWLIQKASPYTLKGQGMLCF